MKNHHAINAIALNIIAALAFSPPPIIAQAADSKDIIQNGGTPAYDIAGQNKDTNIAIGPGSKFFIGGGTQESILSFGDQATKSFFGWHIHDNNEAKGNLPAAIAIGQNTYARTGSIQIGSHTLEKNDIAIGDTTASKLRQFGNASTTLGTNSYTGGGFATTLGSFNVHSSQYEAGGWRDYFNATKNSFATIVGTFNSNESMTGGTTSGIANMIAGTANKVTNSNGALVYGAGNTVKNSSNSINVPISTPFDSVSDMQKALIEGVRKSPGGAALVIGGGNQVDSSTNSQLMGVHNNSTNDTLVLLEGFKNTSSNSTKTTVIGSNNTLDTVKNSQIIGDNRKVIKLNNAVVLGSADNELELQASNAVVLGYNANATVEGGVALGYGSIAARGIESTLGWAPVGVTPTNSIAWKPTSAAVSVGVDDSITRRITNVAAGSMDTDAVNVGQLKALADLISKGGSGASANITSGDKVINVDKGTDSNAPSYTITSKTQFEGDSGKASVIGGSQDAPSTLKIRGGATGDLSDSNIAVVSNGTDTLQIKLAKKLQGLDSLTVNNSVTIGDTAITSNGLAITDGPTIQKTKVDMAGQQIHNVGDGTAPGDAVNVAQLQNTKQEMYSMKSDLDKRIDKAGASAAALAALHPLDFDPDHRFMLTAGLGHYKTRNAVAVGAFWYPTDTGNVLLSAGYANSASDSQMVNLGVTYRFGGDFRHAVNYREIAQREQTRNKDLEAQLSASQSREESLATRLDETRAHAASLEAELTAVKAKLNDLSAKVQKLLAK